MISNYILFPPVRHMVKYKQFSPYSQPKVASEGTVNNAFTTHEIDSQLTLRTVQDIFGSLIKFWTKQSRNKTPPHTHAHTRLLFLKLSITYFYDSCFLFRNKVWKPRTIIIFSSGALSLPFHSRHIVYYFSAIYSAAVGVWDELERKFWIS